MRTNSAAAVLAFLAILQTTSVSYAQLTNKGDAKCRAKNAKVVGKLTSTASKTVAHCWKNVLDDKVPYGDCDDPSVADSSSMGGKGRVGKAAIKVLEGVVDGCDGGKASATALAAYDTCPSPSSVGTITGWPDVAVCLVDDAVAEIEHLHRYVMNPSADDVAAILASPKKKAILECASAVQKSLNSIAKAMHKGESKYQSTCDKKGLIPSCIADDYGYSQAGADYQAKISTTVNKALFDAINGCVLAGVDGIALLRTCGVDPGSIGDCMLRAARATVLGITQSSYTMPGVCPSSLAVRAKPRQSHNQSVRRTDLDIGWIGWGHDSEILDSTDLFSLDCGADKTCGACSLSVDCSTGNCRCSNDQTLTCDEPFSFDADDCGFGFCDVFLGPPLPLNTGYAGVCVVSRLTADLDGTLDFGTGAIDMSLPLRSRVYLHPDQTQPCPTCDGGVCAGGARNGLACTVDATSPTFQDASLDCLPLPGENISGAGLEISLPFSTAPAALNANVPCSGFPVVNCHCNVCTGDFVPCNSDSECAVGTCTSNGAGASPFPNACSTFLDCAVDSDGQGTCAATPPFLYCDGFTQSDGSGVILCGTNADCASVAAGNCTISEDRRCFGDSVTVENTFGGQTGAVVGGNFCVPPTASAQVNGGFGFPGPARVRVAWDIDAFCPDGVTPYRFGGANCP